MELPADWKRTTRAVLGVSSDARFERVLTISNTYCYHVYDPVDHRECMIMVSQGETHLDVRVLPDKKKEEPVKRAKKHMGYTTWYDNAATANVLKDLSTERSVKYKTK